MENYTLHPKNEERAGMLDALIGQGHEPIDVLTNIMHWCAQNDEDFEEMLDSARLHFRAESMKCECERTGPGFTGVPGTLVVFVNGEPTDNVEKCSDCDRYASNRAACEAYKKHVEEHGPPAWTRIDTAPETVLASGDQKGTA